MGFSFAVLTMGMTLGLTLGACSSADPSPHGDQSASTASATCPGPDQQPTNKIAYTHLDDDGDWSLWLMDPDGENPVCLLDTPAADVAAAWSPDGRQLAFNRGDDLAIARADGSDVRVLLAAGGGESFGAPDWSPDGKTIVFTATHDGREEPDIMVVDSTGQNLQTLISSGEQFDFVDEPTWSPDGRNVLFLANDPGGWRDLYLMHPDGSHVRLLLRRGFELDGSGIGWSPDGESIAFQADKDGGCLYVVDASGKNLRRLVEGCSVGVDLTWSPDSGTILWGPSDNGPGDLYAVPSGGGPSYVVDDTSTAAGPSWQPS
jgi:Tol biopolymer transport system component